jgi:hypothetical protein
MAEDHAIAHDPATAQAAAELRAAWDGLLAGIHAARDGIDDPALYPPPASPRNLAEGYRYVLGFLYGAIARGIGPTPENPYFVRAIQPLNRSTIDNADAIYLCTPIDGSHEYLIRGRAADTRHWRGEPPAPTGRKAPHYVILEAPSGYAGDSGKLSEMAPGSRANCSVLDCTKLQVGDDGCFEIRLGPERPEGYTGNFMQTRMTRTRTLADGSVQSREYVSRFVVLRELFYDWAREDLLELFIHRVDTLGCPAPALTPAVAAQQLREVGRIARNQVHFWNAFYAVTLEAYGDMNGDGLRFMPRNDFNQPNAASLATAGGMATNIYCGGIYELAPDEALIMELHQPIEPYYIGFHLGNLWGESLDFANAQSSLNAFQADREPEGTLRYVIAHTDPGIANWIDTTGHPEGYMSVRWAYPVRPKENLPWATAKVVKFAELVRHLPAHTRRVTPEERRATIAMRQEHVQRRYRHH